MDYQIKKNDVMAIIPARGGSKGVPRKNIKPLGGFPLIAYSIMVTKLSKCIHRAIISTDDEEIAMTAKQYGGDVPFLRPKELAADSSKDIDFMYHAINWLQTNEGSIPEFLVHLRPTTPLRDAALVDAAITKFLINKNKYSSLRSAHPAPESPYKWFCLAEEDEFQGLIPHLSNDEINGGRADFPTAYIPDGYVDIIKAETIIQEGLLHGNRIMAYISPICTEVDTVEEFHYLEYELSSKGSPLWDVLKIEHKPTTLEA